MDRKLWFWQTPQNVYRGFGLVVVLVIIWLWTLRLSIGLFYLHVLFASLWLGTDTFVTLFLIPGFLQTPLAAQASFFRWFLPRMMTFNPSVAFLTVLSGVALNSNTNRTLASLKNPDFVGLGFLLVVMFVIGFFKIRPVNQKILQLCQQPSVNSQTITTLHQHVLTFMRLQLIILVLIFGVMILAS
ncbi:hypothetical protein SAMN00768000_3000 [Sulfobacillus thermosulfidooxidans DSM 9293]|uniref:DUF4149 domain-containing protein n=2 Tax=Sulfobacillus thermosulfidooxidans TaxID=28034 RepID=A0A1W1WKD2_SULTA|nr:hypothetical protein [Sulfobacillus thermosulfidooxidans]PSR29491.1 MAG: hypothetical protein C7B47_01880 [Sulfobacillus thermosulfidooxidans]SMC06747.1 hypothetical protein SAMN00768000_3000 [Sulfobacillus thermosulfidooxidans DSM 9293]